MVLLFHCKSRKFYVSNFHSLCLSLEGRYEFVYVYCFDVMDNFMAIWLLPSVLGLTQSSAYSSSR